VRGGRQEAQRFGSLAMQCGGKRLEIQRLREDLEIVLAVVVPSNLDMTPLR
jgi:hypothetical protein